MFFFSSVSVVLDKGDVENDETQILYHVSAGEELKIKTGD